MNVAAMIGGLSSLTHVSCPHSIVGYFKGACQSKRLGKIYASLVYPVRVCSKKNPSSRSYYTKAWIHDLFFCHSNVHVVRGESVMNRMCMGYIIISDMWLETKCYPRSIPTSCARIQLMVQVFMAYIYPMQNICTYTHTHTLAHDIAGGPTQCSQ